MGPGQVRSLEGQEDGFALHDCNDRRQLQAKICLTRNEMIDGVR